MASLNNEEAVPTSDTIVAPATAPGRGAIAVVRLSGPGCRDICDACFDVKNLKPREATFGLWHRAKTNRPKKTEGEDKKPSGQQSSDAAPIDEVLVTFFPGPRSYTGEDTAEISCHGSDLIVREIVDSCIAAGARLARPGEFTERAFLNGKLDLTRAQAVAETIEAATARAGRHALHRLRGGLSRPLAAIEDGLLQAAALIEAYLDFPEEDIGAEDSEKIADHLARGRETLSQLAASYERGRLEQHGARVVLAGEPNVGKSSLFNALLGRDRALVTPIAGTTRDVLDARFDLEGIPVTLIDTAGLREATDEVERLGIGRSHDELAAADAILWLFDATQPLSEGQIAPLREWLSKTEEISGAAVNSVPPHLLIVWNKQDLPETDSPRRLSELNKKLGDRSWQSITISALKPATFTALFGGLKGILLGEAAGSDAVSDGDAAVLADASQHAAISAAAEALTRAGSAFAENLSGELVMVDLQEALNCLAEVTGTNVSEEKLDRIFREFCLGK